MINMHNSKFPERRKRDSGTKGGQTAILVRCSADYRNVSGPAEKKMEKIADQRQRTTEIELPLVRC